MKNIETLSKGAYFTLVGQKKVYCYGGYCRTNKKYIAEDVEDISRCRYLKKGTQVIESDY